MWQYTRGRQVYILSLLSLHVWKETRWHAKICNAGRYKSWPLSETFDTEEEAKQAATKAAIGLLKEHIKKLEA